MNDQVHGLMVRHEQGRAAAQMPPQQAATYAAYSVEDNAGPSVGSILAILRRRLNLIVGVAVAVCAVGAAYTLLQTPSYSATALLMVNPNPEQIVPEKTALNNNRPDAGLIDSEIEVLKSPSLAARLAGELDLDRDPEWNPALRQGHEFAASPAAKTASATP
ncbi:MAG TPA: Wzz/FepE/Etk N-terminal domain-containing protein, partial [Hyphomonadaceae bacterium]|nr:Wzz/FepE/Etk N-terminal domain-containing protein [Hyphomonadaceae bacterium]